MLKGIPVSEGYAVARVLKIEEVQIDYRKVTVDNPLEEISIFRQAIDQTVTQLEQLKSETEKKFDHETSKIFEAQLMIATDPEVNDAVESKIRAESCNLVYAIKYVVDRFVDLFDHLDDEYLKDRAFDLRDVTNRTIKNALNIEIVDLSHINEKVILLTTELTPSQTAQIDPNFVCGFVTEIGGKTSHSAIIARLLQIPAIVGVEHLMQKLKNHQEIILDGFHGEIITDFDDKIKQDYQNKIERYEKKKSALKTMIGKQSQSKDGHVYELFGNIASSKDINHIINFDADGIGLYRTEFLFLDHLVLPTEDEQFEEYKKVLESVYPKPVVIRTLDIGGDKHLPYLNLEKELNPFLGKRAIRLSFDHIDVFKTQLRALLRASAYGHLKIMFPMIAVKEEFIKAKAIVEEVKQALRKEKTKVADFELGIMIEIPSAALMADQLAQVVDFISIGTNDLIQYTMAADRTHQSLTYLYQPLNPAILKLIDMVAQAGKKHQIKVSVCGEMASDIYAGPLLLGLGVEELSMTPSHILKIRKILSKLNHSDLEKLSKSVLKLDNEEQVLSELKKLIKV
ncbi:phosphoenolpyruvate--protein phosphotransferase [Peloplasma aerotolerans]|uniref:Phosphoenolpyruvate-protein phosphotransferase n=1 Tax=Peloplasma aerotolerans TaxID=3044389 RepID=A0AAW6U5R8_9MOLU|nr:phosphoenolpyruvate--protein phosphotransferase [Mariniplasma sp. M4Ah]MDI6452260.1 phosphoenolpyruvate--protein phosphotransferase [Mariniplasma sp. M4Ah]MDR4968204.1 phosphoenolpyruvate--protein phosphotransferase [Acholeplasmataceae bacterium]